MLALVANLQKAEESARGAALVAKDDNERLRMLALADFLRGEVNSIHKAA